MNVTVIVVELLIMFLVIGLLLINPVTFISDYPPEIQEIYYKSQNKEAEKEKASEGACHLADGHSVSGRTLFLPVLHAEQLCQALAHDLHSDGHVHHAPPVDGDVSAA